MLRFAQGDSPSQASANSCFPSAAAEAPRRHSSPEPRPSAYPPSALASLDACARDAVAARTFRPSGLVLRDRTSAFDFRHQLHAARLARVHHQSVAELDGRSVGPGTAEKEGSESERRRGRKGGEAEEVIRLGLSPYLVVVFSCSSLSRHCTFHAVLLLTTDFRSSPLPTRSRPFSPALIRLIEGFDGVCDCCTSIQTWRHLAFFSSRSSRSFTKASPLSRCIPLFSLLVLGQLSCEPPCRTFLAICNPRTTAQRRGHRLLDLHRFIFQPTLPDVRGCAYRLHLL